MITPFIFGKIAGEHQFIDREKEQERMGVNFRSGLNTILMSPRRWGKSSLVNHVAENIERENSQIRICTLDLFSVNNEQQFYEALVKEVLKKSSTRWEEWLQTGREFIKGVVPVLSVGIDPVSDFNVKFEIHDKKTDFNELLNITERIAIQKKIRFVICIDEFQKLAGFHDSLFLQQKLRSVWQKQKYTSYCLYGSKRHLISDMFQNQSMPFYRFGDTMYLGKIEETHWISFISESFDKHNKKINLPDIKLLIEKAQNHPYYVQQLAHQVFINTTKTASSEIIEKAVEDIFLYNEVMYRRELENLTGLQINLLVAIANGESKINSKEIVKKYKLGTPGNVQRLKKTLEDKEIIDFFETKPEFIDPLFALWIREFYAKYRIYD